MVTARVKASDRTKACQQLVPALKKKYGKAPSFDHDVLNTLLFGICLENTVFEQAEEGLETVQRSFFDYNEARVSSITELQDILSDLPEADWKALRIRESLQSIFEERYSYEIEDLKKKGLDAADKYLRGISSLSSFVVNHTLLEAVGAHVFPIDENMYKAALWLGLLESDTEFEQASDQFKSAIRKADVPLTYYLLKSLASDPEYKPIFAEQNEELSDNALDNLQKASVRLKDVLAGKVTPSKPKAKSKDSSASGKATKKSSSTSSSKKKDSSSKSSAEEEPAVDKAAKNSAKKTTKNTTTKKSSKK